MWKPLLRSTALAAVTHSLPVQIAGAFGVVVALVSGIAFVVGGFSTATDTVSWVAWIYDRAATPWLGIFVMVLITVLMLWGIDRVSKSQLAGDKRQAEEYRHSLAQIRAVLQLPALMAKLLALSREIREIDEARIEFTTKLENYARKLQLFLKGEDQVLSWNEPAPIPYATAIFEQTLATMRLRFETLGLNILIPDLQWAAAETIIREDPARNRTVFVSQASDQYKSAETSNNEALHELHRRLNILTSAKKDDIEVLERGIANVAESFVVQ